MILSGAVSLSLGCARPATGAMASPDRSGALNLFNPAWPWTDESGREVALESYQGAPIVVAMIYTSCATLCPLTIERLRELDAAFARRGASASFVLVTLDPVHDDPPRLRRFKEARHLPTSWHLLRGDLPQTHAFARRLGLRASYDDEHIVHDVVIATFDTRGRLVHSYSGWDFADADAISINRRAEDGR
jgi:protein SCO1/2